MNQAAEVVAEGISNDFITLTIGDEVLTIYPPQICIIAKGLKSFAKIDLKDDYNQINILADIPKNIEPIIEGLSYFIARSWWQRIRVRRILRKSSWTQIRELWTQVHPLIGGDDFFVCALSMKSAVNLMAKAK